MNNYTKLAVVALAVLFASASLVAQEKAKSTTKTFKGYLVDKMCGAGMVKSGDVKKATERAMKHTRACALEEHCKASGYGIVMGAMFHKFDAAGDKMAEQYLTKSKKKDNFLVEVTGTADGEMIKVASISEAKADKK
ncbi:MAG: hypothetical protein FJ217_13210 [Ignavibacteria bacterium]|nr:hypothetical protein [Ignavibacteria bacterium]